MVKAKVFNFAKQNKRLKKCQYIFARAIAINRNCILQPRPLLITTTADEFLDEDADTLAKECANARLLFGYESAAVQRECLRHYSKGSPALSFPLLSLSFFVCANKMNVFQSVLKVGLGLFISRLFMIPANWQAN